MGAFHLDGIRSYVHHYRRFCNIAVSDKSPLAVKVTGNFKPLDIGSRNVLKPQLLAHVIQRIVVASVSVDEQEMGEAVRDELLTDFRHISGKCCLGYCHCSGKVSMIQCVAEGDNRGHQAVVGPFSDHLCQILCDDPVRSYRKGRSVLFSASHRYNGKLFCPDRLFIFFPCVFKNKVCHRMPPFCRRNDLLWSWFIRYVLYTAYVKRRRFARIRERCVYGWTLQKEKFIRSFAVMRG